MDLKLFDKHSDFYSALKGLFESLNVPVNYIDEKPLAPKNILNNTFKENSEAFALMDDVYALGMIDESAFSAGKSESLVSIKEKNKDYEGILIFGVTLAKRDKNLLPTRTQLSEITRAFNREFHYTPVVVVFRYDAYISIANVERIAYKQEWREGEKAGKVSLLRDISVKNPHTGHLKILEELRIERTGRNAITNFKELYIYWQEVFSVSILNKQFYKELSDWYFWAMREVSFPGAPKSSAELKEHNATNLIRLLTRLLFVWFVKEKNLVPEELFEEVYLKNELLKDFQNRKSKKSPSSTYYRAVLQNLFHATLNQEMGKRAFRKPGQQMNVTNLLRYESYFRKPEDFVKLVEKVVPFMNGGLFECLDKPLEGKKGPKGGDVIEYIDGFSDRSDNILTVPDYVFFGTEEHINLSEDYGQGARSNNDVSVKGIIDILKSYKFTIDENTPVEQDIALDPELLGRVFENLLASYNPETKSTARKQTGSFYTPREIVNYMVDESLIAYLKTKLENRTENVKELEANLRKLLSYEDVQPFSDKESKEEIIKAIDECKILDPACGSGAFPMGVLHKMVHIIHKIDPVNENWKERQFEKANSLDDIDIRDSLIADIEEAFENNELDYGRKLYLIENCICGADIQPIAVQISKLRFFISLIVDQKINKHKKNHGIRPLPNLETKFVAANTLIGIVKPVSGDFAGNLFDDESIKTLEKRLKAIRHRLFSAKSPSQKRNLREEDKKIREQIAVKLEMSGMGNETARQLAGWDPYEQNTSSAFFDAEWMFDVSDGFSIVIGNPPYVQLRDMEKAQQGALEHSIYKEIAAGGRLNMFQFFIPQAIDASTEKGIICLITQNSLLGEDTAFGCRKHILKNSKVIEFSSFPERDDVKKRVFEGVKMSVCISILQKCNNPNSYDFVLNIWKERYMATKSSTKLSDIAIRVLFPNSLQIPLVNNETIKLLEKIKKTKNSFRVSVSAGEIDMTKYKNRFKDCGRFRIIHGAQVLRYTITDSPSQGRINYLDMRDIADNKRALSLHGVRRIVMQRITGVDSKIRLIMTIPTFECLCANSTNYILDVNSQPLEYIIGILNSKLINFYFKLTSTNTNITAKEIEQIPIALGDFKDEIVDRVKKIFAAGSGAKEIENEIDTIVYRLYGLTSNEIRVLENNI